MADSVDEHIIPPPEMRAVLIGHVDAEKKCREMLQADNLSNGWMICGPSGIGKATFAYRLARAVLSPKDLTDKDSLNVDADSQVFSLVAQKAHPDLFTLERVMNDSGTNLKKEIAVDDVRELINALHMTHSLSKAAVAIIDKADELNRSSANALLKILEEPPANVVLLLLCDAPGRLLPTIRSRCRTLTLKPVEEHLIARFLVDEDWCDVADAAVLAKASGGRPGYAIELAAGDGARAVSLLDDFIEGLHDRPRLHKVMSVVAARGEDGLWQSFSNLLLQTLSDDIRSKAARDDNQTRFNAPVDMMMDVYTQSSELVQKGTGLNADKAHLVTVLGQIFKPLARV